MALMRIALTLIRADATTQVRIAIDQTVIFDYVSAMQEGAKFPAVVIYKHREDLFLADGFHRVEAARVAGFLDIEADVREGTKEDALWFALGANTKHGHRLTGADKKHMIIEALETWPDKSEREIAERAGVSKTYVHSLKPQVVTTDHLPERVTGRDGKTYPRRRVPEPKEPADAEPASTLGKVPRHRRHDPQRIIDEITESAECMGLALGIFMGLELDPGRIDGWIADLERAQKVAHNQVATFIEVLKAYHKGGRS